jgi:hypothetical protein
MNTFDFLQATISHALKDPHSKTLEPDRLPLCLRLRHSLPRGEGWVGEDHLYAFFCKIKVNLAPKSRFVDNGTGDDYFQVKDIIKLELF